MRKILFILALVFTGSLLWAQIEKHVSWTYTVSKQEIKIGDEVDLIFTGKIDKNWYVYSTDMDPNLGPTLPEFTFDKHASYKLIGNIVPIHSKHKYDEVWKGNISIFVDKAEM